MLKKPTPAQIAERLVYLLAAALAPGIPLFFLYGQNVSQGLLFRHFLITGGALAAISLAIYTPLSLLFLRRRRAMIVVVLFWAVFWFYNPLGKIIARGDVGYPQRKIALYLLFFVIFTAFILRHTNMSRLAANTIAVLLCLMFAYNFVPQALAVSAGEKQRDWNEKTGKLPYEIKTEFNVNPNLPHPNIYWLHMDGMMGFDTVERYFDDPQTTLKNELAGRGFIINESARLEAGYTAVAIPAMTSPVFYDSYLAGEFARVSQLTRRPRDISLSATMTENGFSLNDIYPKIEILKAFSDAGYINIANRGMRTSPNGLTYFSHIAVSENVDMIIDYPNAISAGLDIYREANRAFNTLIEFENLITEASALSVVKPQIDEIFERKKPAGANTQQMPAYQETVDQYVTGSDSDHGMAFFVRAMKYAASIQTPHFAYFYNYMMHYNRVNGTVIGEVVYERPIGGTFIFDENGNVYKERLDDPYDVQLYLPQHKYAVKQMAAQIDTIIENDPDAVIILQGDHGIHGFGPGETFDSEFMYGRGYSLEDQLNLNLHVISAVRIPPRYGELSEPLDSLDIARYLVNNFVGKGNYDYLYYTGEESSLDD
jgi:hypothetical protein